MSGYTPAGNFAPAVEGPPGPAGPPGPSGDDIPDGLAVAFDLEREELLCLDDAFVTARLDEWTPSGGAAAVFSTEEGRGVYDMTVTGTVGGCWLRDSAVNAVGGVRTLEVVAGPGVTGWLCLSVDGSVPLRSWFNVSTGALGSASPSAEIINRQIERVEPTEQISVAMAASTVSRQR